MNETSPKCNRCGAPLPPDAPEGLCPRCLVALNLATQTDVAGEAGSERAANKPPSPQPLPAAEVARLFPQLEILECLGRGGMGVVYKARQPRLDRVVALKILSPEKQDDPKFAERFEREARALARLSHQNIVTVYDFGEVERRFFLLMEFVDGLTLRQLLHTRKLSPAEALNIVPKICEALQYAHEQGIVHRDIKPENILLDKQGKVKIADFGIAKIIGQAPHDFALTGAKDVMGTPHYMAPEQIEKPAAVDHRADIYSLGVVFYEMLTSELPLGKFSPPSRKVHIDVRLDQIVLHSLEKDPERRYQHASQVKTDIETIAGSPAALEEAGTRAKRQLRIPAIGLLAAGVMQLVILIALVGIGLPAVAHEGGSHAGYAVIGCMAASFLLAAAVTVLGAAGMLRLRNHSFSVIASVVAAVAGPAAIVGLPFGIWALIVLSQREVKAAMSVSRRSRTRTSGRTMKFAAAAVVALTLGIAIRLMATHITSTKPERLNAPFPLFEVRHQIDEHLHAGHFQWRTTQVDLVSGTGESVWNFEGLEKQATSAPVAVTPVQGTLRLVPQGRGQWRARGEGELSGMEFEVAAVESPTVAARPAEGFSPVVERVIRPDEGDEHGYVFFDFETGRSLPPPFTLTAQSNQDLAFVELTPTLKHWIRANHMDVLIHFAGQSWSRMDLRMQEDFIPETADWGQVTTGMVADVFARWDAANRARAEVPAASQGLGFQDQFDRPKAFRTRSNTTGIMEWAGQSTTPRSVKIRYRLVVASNPSSAASFANSAHLLNSPPQPSPGD